jgi:acetolactate synthase-1/2/3 large subunit
MSKMTGGGLAARVLKDDGVKYLFGIVGGHIYPVLEGCVEMGIEVIDVRHEESAAHMAEGWALATGKPGVCIGTAGPGFTNMLTGIANSSAGGTPLLAMAGHASIHEFDTGALQDFNQIDVVKPMTKFARTVYQGNRIPEYMGMALRHATSGRPGPAFIEIPMDLAFGEVDVDGLYLPDCHRMQAPPAGNPAEIEKALKLIKKAKKPIIVAGGGIWWSQAYKELQEFVEKTGIPVYTRNAGRGSVPDDHPLCIGPGFTFDPSFRNTLNEADLLILLSTRFGFTFNSNFLPASLKVLRVDIESSELCNGRTPDVGVVGDVKMVLQQLNAGINKVDFHGWAEQLKAGRQQMQQMFEPMFASDQVPIHPLRLCREITPFIDKDTILCTDGGDMCVWANLALPAVGPGQFISLVSSIFGCLGVGVPYGIAAKLANPDKKVIVTTGDGSFGLTMMEFDTALRHNIPFVTVIGNDACWGMIGRPFKNQKGITVGCQLARRRYDKMIEAMGGHGEYVEKPEDIAPAIQRALDSGLPACVNVMIDPEIGPGLQEM